ncbi:MAG: hypothetical protein FWD90_03045 [Defluviitaleaceae bacterium]|nr:hypothetical protein [Defluviitaleaceae bacterium]
MNLKPATLVAGGILLPLGAVFFIIQFAVVLYSAANTVAFFVSGGVMCVLGFVFLMVDGLRKRLLERLKYEGTAYEADNVCIYTPYFERVGIIDINTGATFVRIGPWMDAYVECVFRDGNGTGRSVRSHRFMYNTFEKIPVGARVWIDPRDETIYIVEVFPFE